MRSFWAGLTGLAMISLAMAAGPPPETGRLLETGYIGAISLKEYVRYLEEIPRFQASLQQGDFETARQMAAAWKSGRPDLNCGWTMGAMAAALAGDGPGLAENLAAMTETLFLYPDTYESLTRLPDRFSRQPDRERATADTVEFFRKRETFLVRRLEAGFNQLMILNELVHLNLAANDPAGVVTWLARLAPSDDTLLRHLAGLPEWRERPAFRELLARLDQAWHRWDGSLDQKLTGLLQVTSAVRQFSAALPLSPVPDWEARCASFLPRIRTARSRLEYYEALTELVHAIGENHTLIRFPAGLAAEFASPPVTLAWTGDGWVAAAVTDPAAARQVAPGDRLESVNGEAADRYLERQSRHYPLMQFAGRFSPDYRRFHTGRHLLDGPAGTTVEAEFTRMDQSRYQVRLRRGMPARPPAPAGPAVRVDRPAAGIVRFTIPRFDDGSVYSEFLRLARDVHRENPAGIIFDVRENPGGHSGHGDSIFSHFITVPAANYLYDFVPVFIPHKMEARHGYITQYRTGETISPSRELSFGCPVAVLISPATSSAAEDFVFLFRYYRRGHLIGTPTSGATGSGHHVRLPGGGSLRVSMNVSMYFSWTGLEPDLRVEPTRADRAAGRDVVLEAAVKWLDRTGRAAGTDPVR